MAARHALLAHTRAAENPVVALHRLLVVYTSSTKRQGAPSLPLVSGAAVGGNGTDLAVALVDPRKRAGDRAVDGHRRLGAVDGGDGGD
jgi:hypothetical protein